jgi:hypothetical protein
MRLYRKMGQVDGGCICPEERCWVDAVLSVGRVPLGPESEIGTQEHVDAQIYQHCAPSDYDDVSLEIHIPSSTNASLLVLLNASQYSSYALLHIPIPSPLPSSFLFIYLHPSLLVYLLPLGFLLRLLGIPYFALLLSLSM